MRRCRQRARNIRSAFYRLTGPDSEVRVIEPEPVDAWRATPRGTVGHAADHLRRAGVGEREGGPAQDVPDNGRGLRVGGLRGQADGGPGASGHVGRPAAAVDNHGPHPAGDVKDFAGG